MPWPGCGCFLVLFPFAHIVGLCFFGGLYCWVDVGCLPRAVGFTLGCFVCFARTWVLLFDWYLWLLCPYVGILSGLFSFFWVFLS